MNQGKRKTFTPDYLRNFKCIGTPCEDNCCIGWDVDFDRKSYQKYSKVKDGELGQLFRTCVRPNPDAYSDAVDFATVRLKKDKVCPFLNEAHLCKIQSRFGEAYLSNVCATYPRYTNVIDGIYEHSATVSCPEAARLILMNPAGITFTEGEESQNTRCILTYEADTRDRSNPLRVRYLLELRDLSIAILQNRSMPLSQRLLVLGECFEEMQLEKNGRSLPVKIAAFKKAHEAGTLKPRLASASADRTGQLTLLNEITGALNVFTEIDSKRYIAFTREFLAGLRPEGKTSAEREAARVAEGYQRYYGPFMKDHAYLLENYLVNFMFKDLFPAAEGETVFDAYMMLVIRYALVKLHLTGIGLYREGLTEDTVVSFIQAFSKTVEHHKTYLENIAGHMIGKRYNTLKHMAMLIRD